MNYFELKISAREDQISIVNCIKQMGSDCIQTSYGLFIKSSASADELNQALKGCADSSSLQVQPVSETGLSQASKDVQAFAHS